MVLELYGTHSLSTRTCRINRTKCKKCDKMITVANMGRHQKSKPACSVFWQTQVNLMPQGDKKEEEEDG